MIFLDRKVIHSGMPDSYQNLTEQELIDILQQLSEKLVQARRVNAEYDTIKQQIDSVQEEIARRKHPPRKKWRFL